MLFRSEGTVKLKELAEALGSEITNNEIQYEGHKIAWYSETEAFHVDRKKFDTIEEVLAYLQNDEHHHGAEKKELEPALESKRFKRNKK